MKKIGILGFGNMGGSLADGLSAAGGYEILTTEPVTERAEAAAERGYTIVDKAAQLFAQSDITIIAVKPQIWHRLADSLSGLADGGPVISIMAGISITTIDSVLGAGCVARFMPNLAAKVRKALVGVSFSDEAPESFRKDALAIASAIGVPLEVHESLMAAITGISGSGIAFVFSFIHAMALGGVAAGIAYPDALKAALTTMEGAVDTIRTSGEHPIEWLSRVISPAGTTIRGVEALEEGGFTKAVMQAVQQAAIRARELEG